MASLKKLTHSAPPCEMSSPVIDCQAAATSSKETDSPLARAGALSGQTMIRSTPGASGAAITMPLLSRSPRKRGRSSQPVTSARNIARVAEVPGKSNPAASRTTLRPPSAPTR